MDVQPERKLLSLMRSKNHCLSRLLALSDAFLAQPDLSGLSEFESGRAKLVQAIQLFDRKISENIASLAPQHKTRRLIDEARIALSQGDALIRDIVVKDVGIMERITTAQNELVKELNQTRKSRELVSKFKSAWMPQSGEELDSKL